MSALRVSVDLTPLLGPPSGIHQTTAGLVGALMRRDDVEVGGYVLSARGRPSRHLPVAPTGHPDGFEVRHLPLPARLVHHLWARGDFPGARLIAGAADVVHGTNYTVPPAERGRVVTAQDLTPLTRPQWCAPAVRRMGGALRRAVEQGAWLHVSSAAVAAEAEAVLSVAPERIGLIPNGVGPVGPGSAEAGRRLVGSDRYVLALGTTEPRKGLTLLARAMTALPADVALVVAGPVGSDEAELNRSIGDAGIADRCRRLPSIDEGTRSDLLRGAVALVYPSLAEGYGLPPLEALSVGTPVVATAVGALPELIGDRLALLSPGSPTELAAALRAAVDSPEPPPAEVRDRVGELTWERAAARMVELYRVAAA